MSDRSIQGNESVPIPRSRRLRLALVTSSLRLAGAEKQTYYMARALLRAGIDTHFFFVGRGGYYEKLVRQTGIPFRHIYTPNKPRFTLARLTGAFCRLRPHIVLAAQFSDLLYGAAAGRLCQALTLGGVRSDGWHELQSHGRWSHFMLCLTHGFVANSRRAQETLVSQGIQARRIEVLSNVIDLQDFDDRSAWPLPFSLPSGRVIAAAVGSLHPCKRFDRFLEALARARRREPALAGVIAGADCGAKAELHAKANALGLGPPDLIFVGECDRIPALLARSALLVLSSDYEGFPNVILEAMAARLPVVTTAVGDASLIVEQGKTGYVVEHNDTQGMAEFMMKLARSPSTRVNFGVAGRKRVEQEFNDESLADRLVAIFRRFADRQRRVALREMLERGGPGRKSGALSEAMFVEGPAA